MAKKKQSDTLWSELWAHFTKGTEQMEMRLYRKNGWADVINAYLGKLPQKWPYNARLSDPRIRTTIIEKNSRLLNGRLKGRVAPRERGDYVKSRVVNAILDYQWDNAIDGGTMLEKWALMDWNTRMFGAAFGLVWWKTDREFDGPEFKVIDNRDVFVDPAARHIRSANWVQVREYLTFEEIVERHGEYMGADKVKDLKAKIDGNSMGDRRDVRYQSPVKIFRGLDDETGNDKAFPAFEVVTEYRRDKWIVFTPKYGMVLCEHKNPYEGLGLPIVMLRYYDVGDDIYGECEVESVLPIQRAINALLCGFIDEMNQKMRPPLKIANNATVRMDTFVWGPSAKWLVGDSVNNVVEFESRADVISQFNNSYSALVAAFNTAMGDTSIGVSNIDRYNPDKTAAEVNKTVQQQLTRDEKNQMHLEIALKEQMGMWLAMNQQFLFSGEKQHLVYRIVGQDRMREFQQLGLDQMELTDGAAMQMSSLLEEAVATGMPVSDSDIMMYAQEFETPKYPVAMNPQAADEDLVLEPKFKMDQEGKSGELTVVPDDLMGNYDCIPDIQSLKAGASGEKAQSRRQALELVINPNVIAMLEKSGETVNIKEALVTVLQDEGFDDAERLFQSAQPQVMMNEGNPNQAGAGPLATLPIGGVPAIPEAVPNPAGGAGMAQPQIG